MNASTAVSRTDTPPSTLSVIAAGDAQRSAWDEFLRGRAGASFYHLYDWRTVNERSLGHACEYLVATRADGDIAGVLPLTMLRTRLFGRILCSMPFVNYGGPVADDAATAQALTDRAAQRAAELGADYLELRCAAALDTQMPVSLRKVSLTVELKPDPEALFKSFSQKHRKNVRRAQKNELAVRAGGLELLDDFYAVIERSWRDLGTPLYSRDYFQSVVETFPRNTRLYSCRAGDTPVAVALIGMYEGTVEGMWAGARRADLRHLQANYVLYWEMMRDACVRGYTRFTSAAPPPTPAPRSSRTKWNAESQQLYWYFHRPDGGAMPALNVDNPKYQLAIAAWRRLPLWVTRIVGPRIARAAFPETPGWRYIAPAGTVISLAEILARLRARSRARSGRRARRALSRARRRRAMPGRSPRAAPR